MLREVQYKTVSGTSLDNVPLKIDCSILSKEGKIEVVHNLSQNRTAAKQTTVVGDLICSEVY